MPLYEIITHELIQVGWTVEADSPEEAEKRFGIGEATKTWSEQMDTEVQEVELA